MKQLLRVFSMFVLATVLAGCGLQRNQSRDEGIKASGEKCDRQYQRLPISSRTSSTPSKGKANFEQERMTRVIEARAKRPRLLATPIVMIAACRSSSRRRRIVVSAFAIAGDGRELSESEGQPRAPGSAHAARRDENRINIARNRYIKGGAGTYINVACASISPLET